jgi:hypothetical protein
MACHGGSSYEAYVRTDMLSRRGRLALRWSALAVNEVTSFPPRAGRARRQRYARQ